MSRTYERLISLSCCFIFLIGSPAVDIEFGDGSDGKTVETNNKGKSIVAAPLIAN